MWHWRILLIALTVMPGGSVLAEDGVLEATLETHLGPWYRPGAPFVSRLGDSGQSDNRLQLRGRVRNTRGAAVPGALVELWHTDTQGNYPPLRASLKTKQNGSFGINTVLPGHNQGYRARHIHFVITHPTHRELITRIFFKGDINIDEAPYPELAVFLEEADIDGKRILFAEVEFVLSPN